MAVISCTIEYLGDTIDGTTGDPVSVTLTDGTGSAAGAVASVNGKTGAVVLTASDVDAATEAQGALADTAVQPGDLATVATTGDYDDLTNAPTLGTAAAAATTDFDAAGAATTAQTTAEAYTDTQIAALDAGAVDAVASVVAGTNVTVDNTDPQNPVISASVSGGGTGTVTSVNTVEPVDGDVTLTPADIGAATAAQGALADSATQPADLGTAAAADTADFATAAQGALADSATQPGDLGTAAALDVPASGDATSGEVVKGSDSRLTNARTPSAHASTHASAGSDPVTLAQSQVTGLTTDLAAKVPATRTVAGHALSSDVALTDSDVTPTTPNDQTGTTYTFVAADAYRIVTGNNASAQTFTIPPNSSVAYALGTSLQVYNKGAGLITLAAGSGVTIRTPRGAKIAVQYGLAQAVKVAADTWAIAGDLTT